MNQVVSQRVSARVRTYTFVWVMLCLCALLVATISVQRDLRERVTAVLPGHVDASVGLPTGVPGMRVYFTTPALIYPDDPATRRPTPYETALVADIDRARTSIALATFEYNLPSVRAALLRARKRGVVVQVAFDRENLEKPEMADFAGSLERAAIPIHWEQTDAFLHSKFVIIDNAVVWMGSWNVTVNDTYRNNNNLLRITVPQIVANYRAEFAQMAADRFGKQKQMVTPYPRVRVGAVTIENYFSPQDGVRAHILERLKRARHRIRFMAFSFTDKQTRDALLAQQKAGREVQGVFESRNANGTGAAFGALQSGGVDVQQDGNCYTMHHKVFIIDDRTVITGSYNFTSRAESNNDENLIIIDDPLLAQAYTAEFERVYAQSRTPSRC